MWLLDCNSGKVTDRGGGEDSLFMKRRAWNQSLEDSFEQKVENDTKLLIDSILNLPLNTVMGHVTVDCLNKKYNMLYNYQMQTVMLQLSNRDRAQSKVQDEQIVETFLEANLPSSPCEHPFLVRFNHLLFANKPLVLVDNAISIFVTPPLSPNSGGSICFFMPISPYYLIFFGSLAQLEVFLFLKQDPHTINKYRIQQEEEKCLVASQNETYIKWLATEYKHGQPNPKNRVTSKSQRNFL